MSEVTISFSEMRNKFLQGASGDFSFLKNSHNRSVLENRLFPDWNEGGAWIGDNTENVKRYFRDGFHVSGLDSISPSAIPARKRKRPRFNDCEGDFRYDLFTVGDENHYVDWTQRESIPGITVEFGQGFRSGVKATTIADYFRWILRVLIALEESGIDSEILAVCKGSQRFERNPAMLTWKLRVKEMGKRTDYLAWSALFSPGSYRILGFFTNTLAAEGLGYSVNSGMGSSESDGWGVRWNAETKTLQITHDCYNKWAEFPEGEMTENLIAALASAKGD